MPGRLLATAALAAVVALSGCSSSGGKAGAPKNDDFTEGVVTPGAPKTIPWGQPGEVVGENGGKLKVTPLGVLYHKGPYKGVDGPENGWFVAIVMRAEAVSQQDDFLAPASGGGFRWRGQGQTLWGGEGNATSAPWVGAVPAFGDPIEPGEAAVGVETYDAPVKGGRLIYINQDESIVSWTLPAADTGSGLEKVRKRIKEFS